MKYKIGDIVVSQSESFGQRYVKIETKESDIRFGRPGFSGFLCDVNGKPIKLDDPYGNKVWGYNHQVVKVL